MKKRLLILPLLILWIIWFSQAKDTCDQTFYWNLRYNKGYIFNDTFNNPWSSYYLRDYRVDYREQSDYNNSSNFPIFWRTDIIKSQKYEVKKWQNLKFIEAKTPYYIYSVPTTRSKDNLFLKYTVIYSSDVAWTKRKDHTECKYYEISRCWDGIIDSTYWEICDNWKNNSDTVPWACKLDCTLPTAKKVDLSLIKDVNKAVVSSWENVIFTITVKNDWPENATNVEVTDLLPSAYIYVSNTVSQWSYNSSNWIRTIWNININERKVLTLTAKVKNNWNYLNIAEVTKCWEEDIDSTPNNHIASEDDQDDAAVSLISTEIDIEKKLVNNVIYQSWDLVTFRMDFVNKWPSIAHHVIITDYLPRWMTYVSSAIKMDDWSIIPMYSSVTENNIDTIKYYWFDLNVNKWWYIILTGISKWLERVSETTNNVFIKSDEDEDHSWAKFEILNPTTILSIDKTINKSLFNLWEIVNFKIAVRNNWPIAISWLQIQDIRPDTSCIIPSWTRSSDHQLIMTNPNNPYTRTYNQTFNIHDIINIYLSWQVKNDTNCIKNYLNTWTLTYNILWQTKYLRDVVPFSVIGQDNQCKSIFVSNTSIKLDSNYQWSTDVVCYTDWTNWNIQIDCGNWKTSSINWATSLSYRCDYTETNYPKNYTISCKVNNTSNSNCNQVIELTKSGWGWGWGWYCGNWRLDSFESCDITDSERAYNGWDKYNWYYIIWDRADNGRHNISNKYDDGRYYCKNCWLKELPWEERYTPPACFNTQTTISVQKWEYLPFRWNLEDKDNFINWDDCDDWDDGKILKDTLECTFKVYNWKNSDSDEDYVLVKTKDCDTDERNNKKLFDYFENSNVYRSLDDAFWKYYFKVDDFAKDWVYGEYKLALDKVEYEYCDNENEKKWTVVERVCEVDFAVTKPYIAQKNNFNITPKATNLKLEWFYDIFGIELIKKTDLDKIMILDEWQYNASSNVYSLMTSFIKKYEKLAIKIDKSLVSNMIESNSSVQVSKVPNQQIYIFQWNWELKLKELANTGKPFTMIVKWLNLIVKWNIEKTNWMFLVDGWKISFEESDTNRCKKSQTVQWIFISNKWFTANNSNIYQKTTNDDLDNPRCVYGWLKVKWVLIWNNIESIIMARRSQLNDWFRVNSTNESAIKIERRNEIFNWASVLIEYSPALRESLPPGANEFTKSLEIYKK